MPFLEKAVNWYSNLCNFSFSLFFPLFYFLPLNVTFSHSLLILSFALYQYLFLIIFFHSLFIYPSLPSVFFLLSIIIIFSCMQTFPFRCMIYSFLCICYTSGIGLFIMFFVFYKMQNICLLNMLTFNMFSSCPLLSQ